MSSAKQAETLATGKQKLTPFFTRSIFKKYSKKQKKINSGMLRRSGKHSFIRTYFVYFLDCKWPLMQGRAIDNSYAQK